MRSLLPFTLWKVRHLLLSWMLRLSATLHLLVGGLCLYFLLYVVSYWYGSDEMNVHTTLMIQKWANIFAYGEISWLIISFSIVGIAFLVAAFVGYYIANRKLVKGWIIYLAYLIALADMLMCLDYMYVDFFCPHSLVCLFAAVSYAAGAYKRKKL